MNTVVESDRALDVGGVLPEATRDQISKMLEAARKAGGSSDAQLISAGQCIIEYLASVGVSKSDYDAVKGGAAASPEVFAALTALAAEGLQAKVLEQLAAAPANVVPWSGDPLEGLVDRSRADPAAAFAPAVLAALARLHGDNAGEFQSMLARLKRAGVGITDLRKDVARAAKREAHAPAVREYPEVQAAIEGFNERFAFVRMKARLAVAIELTDGIDFMMERDFHSLFDNERVDIDDEPTPISKLWKASPARRTYLNGVTFSPERDPEPGTLNLWRGWKVEPDPDANCQMFLDHLAEVICRGDEASYRYALGWLAHMVQRPWEKPGVAFVVRGKKGAGKDTFAEYVAHMIGDRHSPVVSDPKHVTGNFNGHLEAALFLRVEEAFWAGDKSAEGNLKTMITSPTIQIERKGIDGGQVPSCLRMFISANANWVVPASEDERRFFVLEASEERRGDRPYFQAMREEMEGRGPAALLHYLQNYDLTGFEVRDAPQTEALAQQKLETLRGLPKWWLERLQEGDLLGRDGWANGSLLVGRDELRDRYAKWLEGRRHDGDRLSPAQIGRELKKMLPDLRRCQPRSGDNRLNEYAFPGLSECRAAFDKHIGHPIDWE